MSLRLDQSELTLTCDRCSASASFATDVGVIEALALAGTAGWKETFESGDKQWLGPCCSGKGCKHYWRPGVLKKDDPPAMQMNGVEVCTLCSTRRPKAPAASVETRGIKPYVPLELTKDPARLKKL